MTLSLSDPSLRYPVLHRPDHWAWGRLDVEFRTEPPPDGLVTNTHVLAFTAAGRLLLCRDGARGADGGPHWFLPGGTREAGESVRASAERELLEEAGAALRGPLHTLGAHYAVSRADRPYRPWQPHPHKAWLWCAAAAEPVGPPQIPEGDGAEQIEEVRAATPAEARALLGLAQGAWCAELVSLGEELWRAKLRHEMSV